MVVIRCSRNTPVDNGRTVLGHKERVEPGQLNPIQEVDSEKPTVTTFSRLKEHNKNLLHYHDYVCDISLHCLFHSNKKLQGKDSFMYPVPINFIQRSATDMDHRYFVEVISV
jgi:hypothetical protein